MKTFDKTEKGILDCRKTRMFLAIFFSFLLVMSIVAFADAVSPEDAKKKRDSILTGISISSIVSFFDLIPSVAADQGPLGCCEEDVNNNYCQENVYQYDSSGNRICKVGKFHSGATTCNPSTYPNCRKITCVPAVGDSSECHNNEFKIQCIANGGKERVAGDNSCEKGCCDVAGLYPLGNGVIERKQCNETATYYNQPASSIQFDKTILNEAACTLWRTNPRGCCIQGAGICSYTTSRNCLVVNDFHENSKCSLYLDECGITNTQYKKACSTFPGEEDTLYWMSEKNTLEDQIEDCELTGSICVPSATGDARCKSTECTITPTETDDSGRGYFEGGTAVDKTSLTLQDTESMCYNFLYDREYYFSPAGLVHDGVKAHSGKTTGLQSYEIHCDQGDTQIIELGTDRKTLCRTYTDTSTIPNLRHADNFSINTDNCMSCGSGGLFGDIGDYIQPLPIVGFVASLFVSKACIPDRNGFTDVFGMPSCKDQGDCIYDSEMSWVINEVGSCVPKVPAGNSDKCNTCGGGGDDNAQYCNDVECNLLGDCDFKATSTQTMDAIRDALKNALLVVIGLIIIVNLWCATVGIGTYPACMGAGNGATSLGWGQAIIYPLSWIGGAGGALGLSNYGGAAAVVYAVYFVNQAAGAKAPGSCYAEVPLDNSNGETENCDLCNNPYTKCHKARCEILGKNCVAKLKTEIGEATEGDDYKCIVKDCSENQPQIQEIDAIFIKGGDSIYTASEQTINNNKAIDIRSSHILDYGTDSINVTLKLNVNSKCKWTYNQSLKYSEIDKDYVFMPQYNITTNTIVPIITQTTGMKNQTLYLKCVNLCDVPIDWDNNFIKFQTDKKPDEDAPHIDYLDPQSATTLSEELQSVQVQIILDENGWCGFSNDTNRAEAYNETTMDGMYPMNCLDNQLCYGQDPDNTGSYTCAYCNMSLSLTEGILMDWADLTTSSDPQLAAVASLFIDNGIDRSRYHFLTMRCGDSAGNLGSPFNYSLETIPSAWGMSVTAPKGECSEDLDCGNSNYFCANGKCITYYIKSPFYAVNATRKAMCKYTTDIIADTSQSSLLVKWNSLANDTDYLGGVSGKMYSFIQGGKTSISGESPTIRILCKECLTSTIKYQDMSLIENVRDTTDPTVIRAYSTGANLKILTDEKARCFYSLDNCDFNVSDTALCSSGTTACRGMSYSDDQKTHWTNSISPQSTYYIKCYDMTYPEAPNYPGSDPVEGGCTTTVKPFKVSGF